MKICICGGGNLSHVLAGYLSSIENVSVSVLTRNPDKWGQTIEVKDKKGFVYSGPLKGVTFDAARALEGADIAILCLPGFAIREELEKIKPYLLPRTAVGSVVSSTGFFFQAFDTLKDDQPLFGFQRVPFISRIVEYGHSAELLGYKNSLSVAVEHSPDPDSLVEILKNLFKVPINLMKSHYEVSLSNSNPILHTSRLYSLWKGYKSGDFYTERPDFYSDWDRESSEILIAMDSEFQELLKVMPVRREAIPPILDYYESFDADSLTQKLRSITAFQGLLAPMTGSEGKWKPDFSSRYFTEDFPFGLRFIHSLAHHNNISTPTIDKVYEWGMHWVKEEKI